MMRSFGIGSGIWTRIAPRFLPFADAATEELPMRRLLRLSLFQVSVGLAIVLTTGTLNRVMIVELGVQAWLVAAMVALPLLVAPFRALIGFKSDVHRSFLGWKRVPYIWFGTMLQFGGFAIMPFALLVLTGQGQGPAIYGHIGAALAFLMVGAGLHTTQTAGLALANDLAPERVRPRVVALLYVMLLLGMIVSALVFGYLLEDFGHTRLVQVVQGAAMLSVFLNLIALWKQEPRNPDATRPDRTVPTFLQAWRSFSSGGRVGRLLLAIGIGTAGFSMQDILLEPYGGEVLGLDVSATTELTAMMAAGGLVGFVIAGAWLGREVHPLWVAAVGAVAGIFAFSAVIFSAPLESAFVFRCGTTMIGLGAGLFAVGTLVAAMDLATDADGGLALGAWGAVQASAAGLGIALGGLIRDLATGLASDGTLGSTLMARPGETGYGVVYHLEILLLFLTLAALGPLVTHRRRGRGRPTGKLGLSEFPG